MDFEHYPRVVVAASGPLDARIREAWGNGSGPAPESLVPLSGSAPPAALWDLAIVEYTPGDVHNPASFFRIIQDGMPGVPVLTVSDACVEQDIVEALRAGAADHVSSARLTSIRSIAERALQAERERTGTGPRHQQAILVGINRILEEATACETEEHVGALCLRVALELTASHVGFLGEMSADGALRRLLWAQGTTGGEPFVHHTLQESTLPDPLARILALGGSLLSNDPAADLGGPVLAQGMPPLTSILAAPLCHGGTTIGILAVANRAAGYTSEQQDDLEALTPSVTKALLGKRAELAMRASERSLATDLAGMMRLQALSSRLCQPDDLLALLQEIITAAAEITGTDKGNIQLVDPATQELHMVVHQGLSPAYVEHFRNKGCPALCGAAHRSGRRVIAEDVCALPSLQGTADLELLEANDIRCVVSTPLICRDGRVVGVLNNHYPSRHPPAEHQLRFIDLLARMAADVIDRHRAEEALRATEARLREELERQVAARTAELAESEARFRAVFENSAIGIAVVDAQGRVLGVNPALEQLLARPADAILGRPLVDFCAPGIDAEELQERYEALLASDRTTAQREGRWRRADGQVRAGRFTASVVRDATGAPRFTICMIEDVTDERQARAALIQAERLSVTAQLTAAFAHEIKNPLQAVIGCLGLLAETLAQERTLSDEAQRFLHVARSELHRADRVVNRLREFHRRGADTPTPTSVANILEEVLLLTRKQCEHQFVTAEVQVKGELPPVLARQDELRQLFLNLVLNALEAMPEGGVMRITAEGTIDPPGVRVTIADSGLGIPAEALPHIFDFLYTTKESGTGLGLFVCQDIVDHHGGEITATSVEGAGTTVTVWLPA